MCQILTEYQTLGQAAAPLQIGKLRLKKGSSGIRQDLACASVCLSGKTRDTPTPLLMAMIPVGAQWAELLELTQTPGFSQASCQGALQGWRGHL